MGPIAILGLSEYESGYRDAEYEYEHEKQPEQKHYTEVAGRTRSIFETTLAATG
jgi:hypothetical protein